MAKWRSGEDKQHAKVINSKGLVQDSHSSLTNPESWLRPLRKACRTSSVSDPHHGRQAQSCVHPECWPPESHGWSFSSRTPSVDKRPHSLDPPRSELLPGFSSRPAQLWKRFQVPVSHLKAGDATDPKETVVVTEKMLTKVLTSFLVRINEY